jgi:type I restriction enzyme S subunit
MELKPSPDCLAHAGFKQSDIGLIPNDWSLKGLGEIAELDVGLSKPKIVFGPGCPVVTVQDLYSGSIIDVSGLKQVVVTADEIKKYRLAKDDILIGNASVKRDGIGYANRFDGATEDVIFAKYAYRASNLDSVLPLFLHHVLRADFCRQWIVSNSQTGTLTNLNKSAARAIPITVPSTIEEQRAIATALSDVDALIAGLQRLIAKKRDIKQATMQQLLTGQTRLPGFIGKWISKRLGDTAILKARIGWQGLTTAEYLSSGDHYLVTGTEFNQGYVDWASCHFVDAARYKQDKYIQLRPRDVLVTKDGTIGKVALVPDLPGPATLNSGVFVIRPLNQAFIPEFFYYLLCSQFFADFLGQLAAGSTINHLYQKDFVSFVYRTPATHEEQTAIATVLSDMDADLSALEARLTKTRAIKQGMMQELLTGRTRLI